MSDDLKKLEERERLLREEINSYEQAEKTAANIAVLQKKKAELQKTISDNLTLNPPEAGTIKRLTSVLGALSPVDAIYKLNEESFKSNSTLSSVSSTFATSYAKDIVNRLKTFATGKDYSLNEKTYKDIITKQMGFQDNWLTTTLGVVGDIAIDPVNFGAMKPVFKTIGFAGTELTKLASKIPQVEKGIENVKRSFDIFYDLEKTGKPEDVAKFTEAFREAVNGNFTKLKDFGLDVSKYTGTKKKDLSSAPFSITGQKEIAGAENYYKILDEAFLNIENSGFIGNFLGNTSKLYKRLMSWSPRFQTRNIMGAVTQNIGEGTGIGDFWNAGKLLYTKGEGNQALYETLKKSGVLGQTGMAEQATGKGSWFWETWMRNVANTGESINRTALILKEVNEGRPLLEAINKSEDVFYRYGKEYLTPVEKQIEKFLPFWSFNKQNFLYYNKAIPGKAAYYSGLGKVKQGTEPDDVRQNSLLSPTYWKELYSIGNVGNIGFQSEDYLRNAFGLFSGDFKNLWGQAHPILRGLTEEIADWNFYKNKPVSKDTYAGQYANMPTAFQKLVGYDANANTVNPYIKHTVETAIGPVLQPIKDLLDPTKSNWRAVTSIRDYDLSTSSMAKQSAINAKQESFYDHLLDRLGVGTPTATASATVSITTQVDNIINKNIAEWEKNNKAPGKFGKEYQWGGGPEQTMYFNATQKMLESTSKSLKMAGPDIGENAAKSFTVELDALTRNGKFFGLTNTPEYKAQIEAAKKANEFIRPRTKDEAPYTNPDLVGKYRYTLGLTPLEQYHNKALEETIEYSSKTATLWKQSFDKTAESIRRGLEADIAGATMQFKSQRGGISDKAYQSRIDALRANATHAMRDLEAKEKVAISNIIEHWAKAEVNGIEKIELERKAAQQKYLGSDDYKYLAASKNYKLIKIAQSAIDAEYDQKRNEELTKQVKAHMETVEKMTKGQAENIIQALKAIYDRGGLTVETFYERKLETVIKQQVTNALSAIDGIKAVLNQSIKTTKPLGGSSTKYDSLINESATDNGLDPNLLKALIKVESNFNPSARSKAGAIGLTQLMPDTAKELGVDPLNIQENIKGGAKYLAMMLDKFNGDLRSAITAYNAGPGKMQNVLAGKDKLSTESSNYYPKVEAVYKEYSTSTILPPTGIVAPQEPISYRKPKYKPQTVTGKVSYIEDGDTLHVELNDGSIKKIRAAYIDAPETPKPAMGDKPAQIGQPFGNEAKKELSDLVGGLGSIITANITEIDRYGRSVATIYKDDLNINLEMIKKGFAEIYAKYMPDKKTFDTYSTAQSNAQKTGAGVWMQGENYVSPEAYRSGISVTQTSEQSKGAIQSIIKLNEVAEKLKVFQDNPDLDTSKSIQVIKETIDIVAEAIKIGDVKALEEGLRKLNDTAREIESEGISKDSNIAIDKQKNALAISEINQSRAKILNDVYSQTGVRSLGIRSTTGADVKFGYSTSPYAPPGYDANAEALKTKQENVAESFYQRMQNIDKLKGDSFGVSLERGIGESPTAYMKRIEDELEMHEENKAALTQAGQEKLKLLQQDYAAYVIASQNTVLQHDKQVAQQRLQTAGDMANLMTQTASVIYEASGSKSKEAFYAMKAMAIAEATIKGYAAVIKAFDAGLSIGGPYALAAANTYATITMAFVGAQIGAMVSQMVNGPEGKAEGGPIEGGSGTKDDVPIMAMKDEYVIKQSSARKYGRKFLNALNKGLIPVDSLNFAIPDVPDSRSQTYFSDGGSVGPARNAPVTVELKNESDTKLQARKAESRFDGQQYIVSVFIDALDRNVGGLRNKLGGV